MSVYAPVHEFQLALQLITYVFIAINEAVPEFALSETFPFLFLTFDWGDCPLKIRIECRGTRVFIVSDRDQGAVSIRKTVLPGMAIPMLKIRRPNGRLIFNMEIAIRR